MDLDLVLLTVTAVVALALLFDFSNGFHDAANSIATVVATRAMSPKMAVWFSALFNFLAYFFVGTAVANTVAKTVKSGTISVPVIFAGLLAALVWNYLTWFIGMPSSSSHAIIGGLVGAGVAAGGLAGVSWSSVQKVVIAIVISPLVAFSVAALGAGLVHLLQKVTKWSDDAKPFKWLQLGSAAAVSFGHGANDAQKTMGVIAALLAGAGYLGSEATSKTFDIPQWVAIASYATIALGTVWGGWRIIETMGLKLTSLNAKTGVAANIGAVTAIFGATNMGVPISTTHAAASSVVGAGTASGRGANWKVVGEMVIAWIITIPATSTIAFVVYKMTQFPTPMAVFSVGLLVLVVGGAIVWAMRHSITAKDIEEELPPAEPVVLVTDAEHAAA